MAGSGTGHTRTPHASRQGKARMHPQSTGRKGGGLRSPHASLPLYSSTSARFPSSALPFNRMSLSSGDMK